MKKTTKSDNKIILVIKIINYMKQYYLNMKAIYIINFYVINKLEKR